MCKIMYEGRSVSSIVWICFIFINLIFWAFLCQIQCCSGFTDSHFHRKCRIIYHVLVTCNDVIFWWSDIHWSVLLMHLMGVCVLNFIIWLWYVFLVRTKYLPAFYINKWRFGMYDKTTAQLFVHVMYLSL